MIVAGFQCMPREKIRKPRIRGHCIDVNATHIGSGAVNVISDFSIFQLPLKSIWDLQMDIKPKITLPAMFATGFLAAELVSGLVCGCLPVLPKFFRHYFQKTPPTPSSRFPGASTNFSDYMRRGKSATHCDVAPLDLPSNRRPGAYLELSERNEMKRAQGCPSTIAGGMRRPTKQDRSQEGYEAVDLERGLPENCIRKKLRIGIFS
ncbi:hypothetical protein N7G274_005366 [Stereocaulon virgatum]|uniref:Rhodopsin domain-containing protein n=1 Tax=Stereocaulon virgatum TaxID=373712 RepID=A0ABR4A924_9LECA